MKRQISHVGYTLPMDPMVTSFQATHNEETSSLSSSAELRPLLSYPSASIPGLRSRRSSIGSDTSGEHHKRARSHPRLRIRSLDSSKTDPNIPVALQDEYVDIRSDTGDEPDPVPAPLFSQKTPPFAISYKHPSETAAAHADDGVDDRRSTLPSPVVGSEGVQIQQIPPGKKQNRFGRLIQLWKKMQSPCPYCNEGDCWGAVSAMPTAV